MNAIRSLSNRCVPSRHRQQRGVATLLVTLVMLVILTIIVLSSSNVALFEQKTSTNENRQRLADSATEYALNLGVEYFKANVVKIASEKDLGWLPAGTAPHWTLCSSISPGATHPCMSEPNATRRAQLYFYNFDDAATSDDTHVPINSLILDATGQLDKVGGVFATTGTNVTALLCRLDTLKVDTDDMDGDGNITEILPQCRATPGADSSNRIAVTVISKGTVSGEGAASEMKATLGNFDSFSVGAAVPLVASGSVNAVGNATIVTAANGGGTGIPVSIWSAEDADIDCSGGGSCASVSTCQVGEFLKATPEAQLLTTCATVNNACNCPAMSNGATEQIIYAKNPNMLSGHVPGPAQCCENLDILDIDRGDPTIPEDPITNASNGTSPDITFYPGQGIDDFNDLTDDSLFEWVFGVSGESNTIRVNATDPAYTSPVTTGATLVGGAAGACPAAVGANCAVYYLTEASELNAQQVSCAQLSALGESASGLYYVADGTADPDDDVQCALPAQIGTPEAPALVVINNTARMNSTLFYGMLFLRSSTKAASLVGVGHAQVFGSVVVEGDVDNMAGGFTIVYSNINISKPGGDLPESTRFGLVPSSWLDNSRAGF